MDYYHHINEYKMYKLNREICEHYGLRNEIIPVRQMLEYVKFFFSESITYLIANNYSKKLIYRWKIRKWVCYILTIASSIKVKYSRVKLKDRSEEPT